MSYWKQVLPILEEQGKITCFEIQRITNSTCPQKIVQQLRQKGFIRGYEDKVGESGKTYREHYHNTFRMHF